MTLFLLFYMYFDSLFCRFESLAFFLSFPDEANEVPLSPSSMNLSRLFFSLLHAEVVMKA